MTGTWRDNAPKSPSSPAYERIVKEAPMTPAQDATDCPQCHGTRRAIYFSEQSWAHEERVCHLCRGVPARDATALAFTIEQLEDLLCEAFSNLDDDQRVHNGYVMTGARAVFAALRSTPSASAGPQDSKLVQGWEVEVRVNGNSVLTIGHNHLAGVEDIDDYRDIVEASAHHLLSFIGASAGPQAEAAERQKMSLIEELENPPRLDGGVLDEPKVTDLMRTAAFALSTMIGVAAKAARGSRSPQDKETAHD